MVLTKPCDFSSASRLWATTTLKYEASKIIKNISIPMKIVHRLFQWNDQAEEVTVTSVDDEFTFSCDSVWNNWNAMQIFGKWTLRRNVSCLLQTMSCKLKVSWISFLRSESRSHEENTWKIMKIYHKYPPTRVGVTWKYLLMQDPKGVGEFKSKIRNPRSKIQTPKSKLQNPKSKRRRLGPPQKEGRLNWSKIQNPKSKIPNPRSKIQTPQSKIQDPRVAGLGPEAMAM